MAVPGGTDLSLRMPGLCTRGKHLRFRRICCLSKPPLLIILQGDRTSFRDTFALCPFSPVVDTTSSYLAHDKVGRADKNKADDQEAQCLRSSAREAACLAAQSFGDGDLNDPFVRRWIFFGVVVDAQFRG